MNLFEVMTPLAFTVRVSESYWRLITEVKHPVMKEREEAAKAILQSPDVIRRSRNDAVVYLFYRQEDPNRWLCAVVKRLDGDGFLITAYPTDAIKEGEQVWTR